MLTAEEADAALIPVIEYQRIPDLRVVPGACVASRHMVRSVVLASRVPIDQVRSVALDSSSRTSAGLIRIILGKFLGVEATYEQLPPRIDQMLEGKDAALIIGDPAMLIDRSSLRVYDLAEEWYRHTGLPFVFAFWAVRGNSTKWPGEVDFVSAKNEGLAHANEIAAEYAHRLGLPEAELLHYLTRNIAYDLDEECLRGLALYYQLAAECELIPQNRELVTVS